MEVRKGGTRDALMSNDADAIIVLYQIAPSDRVFVP
jgi:hypothetical protein